MSVFAILAAMLLLFAAGAGAPPPRLLWSGARLSLQGGPSRDGRFFSYADARGGALLVRDVRTGEDRVVARPAAGSGEYAYFSTISPDSKRIAYAWHNRAGFYEIRVAQLDGSGERTLYSNEEVPFVQPCAWTPDGKQILTLFFRSDNISQIVLLPAAGGTPKTLRSLQWVYPKRMDVSPDGRYIVYDSFAPGSQIERTIYTLSIDGAAEKRLMNTAGNHLFPLWTPDGKSVVYLREDAGAMNAWLLRVENGEAAGEPRLAARDMGRALPLGLTAAGEYYFGQRRDQSDIVTGSEATPWPTKFPGRNYAPAWSPDGATLAYVSRRGIENFGVSAAAVVVGNRELHLALSVIEHVRWSPGGDALLVSGMDGKGRAGLFHVDLAKGEAMRPVAAEAGTASRGFPGVFSADGGTVYYIYNNKELRAHSLAGEGDAERTLATGVGLGNLVISGDGKMLALTRASTIVLQPTDGRGPVREIPFDGVRELEWDSADQRLWAARDAELWQVPLTGDAAPVRVKAAIPRGRQTGFSIGPKGELALTIGSQNTEVWTAALAR